MMKQIRVIHLSNYDLGLKVHLQNYLRYQKRQGYCVSAISHPGKWLSRDSVVFDRIPVKIMNFKPQISPLADLRTMIRLIIHFRRQRVDIVHTHAIKPGLLGRIAARIAGIPIVVHTYHGLPFTDTMPALQRMLCVVIERLGSACCDLVLSQNQKDIEFVLRKKLCPSNKIAHLGNGIDLSRFDPNIIPNDKLRALRRDLGIQEDEQVIGIISRWEMQKGIREFLQAASYLKSMGFKQKYLMVGAFEAHKPSAISAAELIRNYGLEKDIIALGYREDIPELISLMDIAVLPSYREGFPRFIMESAALGKPIVATRVRGILETVQDGVTGLLVPARDGTKLAEGILKLLKHPELASRLGKQARQRALKDFDEQSFFRKTDIAYRRLLTEKYGEHHTMNLQPVPTPKSF
jgi:glycosyltransferase involved in cell wall biosynthesis